MAASNVKIASYNSTGLSDIKVDYIRNFLNESKVDILLLQETWLLSTNLGRLGEIHQDYMYHGLSGVDHGQLLTGRPYGGVAILWNKKLAGCIRKVQMPNTKRACAIDLTLSQEQILIINCYMPVDNFSKTHVAEEFLKTADVVECVINQYPDHLVLLGGDINVDTSRENAHDQYYMDFLLRNDMVDVWDLQTAEKDYTFVNYTMNTFSCIDHFAVSRELATIVNSAKVKDDAVNLSAHKVIQIDLNLQILSDINKDNNSAGVRKPKIAWHKVNDLHIEQYQKMINSQLLGMCDRTVTSCQNLQCEQHDHKTQIDKWCEELIECCMKADCKLPRENNGKKCMPGWVDNVKQHRDENIFWFETWREAGKPKIGILFENMKEAKRQYTYAVRRCKRRQNDIRKQKMAQCVAENDSRNFFKEVKKLNPRPAMASCINSVKEPQKIAQCFADKYEALYNSTVPDASIMDEVNAYIVNGLSKDKNTSDVLSIDTNTVRKAVQELKREKSDGEHGYYSSHLIHAGTVYFWQLSELLKSMIVHGHYPESLLTSTIVSIPKDPHGDMCSADNYRGIALSSSIGKLFDKIFLERNSYVLKTEDLQFAYKKDTSTTMCTLLLKEIVKYYRDNQSDVYSCFIDATKAFDKIKHDKLFSLLMERGMSSADLRLLVDLYSRQLIRTGWKGHYSSTFSTTNGIRQGGIASPILFCCYMDELLKRLKQDGVGCWFLGMFLGSVAYADDLTLLSPTREGLQQMIATCERYGEEYGMSFNAKKSMCMLFSRKKKTPAPLSLNGNVLLWVDKVKYLGNYISYDLRDNSEIRMKKGDLIGQVNCVIGNLHSMSPEIIMTVFNRKCCHFYGSTAWLFDASTLDTFEKTWNRCVRRLLGLPNTTHSRFLPHLAKSCCPKDKICRMFVRMFVTMGKSNNTILRRLADHSLHNPSSVTGSNRRYVERLYGVTVDYNTPVSLKLSSCKCSAIDFSAIQAIKDLKDGCCDAIFNSQETVYELLYFICIN